MRDLLLRLFERTHEWEINFLEGLQSIRNPILDWILVFFTRLGDVGIIWIIICVVLLLMRKYRKVGFIGLLALLIGAIITDLTLKGWIARERPFTYLSEERLKEVLIIQKLHSLSFPSGHTTSSFAVGLTLSYYLKQYRIPILLLASIIAFSRMYLYVHFPTDILAGIIVGSLSALLAILISKHVLNRYLRFLNDGSPVTSA